MIILTNSSASLTLTLVLNQTVGKAEQEDQQNVLTALQTSLNSMEKNQKMVLTLMPNPEHTYTPTDGSVY